jgi:hypothetical protein
MARHLSAQDRIKQAQDALIASGRRQSQREPRPRPRQRAYDPLGQMQLKNTPNDPKKPGQANFPGMNSWYELLV